MTEYGIRGPSDAEQAQLIRAIGRNLAGSPERVDLISASSATVQPGDTPRRAGNTPAAPPRERISGKLLDHGRDAFRHDPNEDPSYFVRLRTPDGIREVWGKDIERAVTKSLTQPQIGEEVVLQRTGRDAVTVKRPERKQDGEIRPREGEVFRNRWVLEKRSFFEARAAAARVVRDETVGPREAVREHPELAGTYLNLRAAELASKSDGSCPRSEACWLMTSSAGSRCSRFDYVREPHRHTWAREGRSTRSSFAEAEYARCKALSLWRDSLRGCEIGRLVLELALLIALHVRKPLRPS